MERSREIDGRKRTEEPLGEFECSEHKKYIESYALLEAEYHIKYDSINVCTYYVRVFIGVTDTVR